MGLVTWIVVGAVVGLILALVWRPPGRFGLIGDVIVGIIGAVLLGAILRGLQEIGFDSLRPVGVRLFTWLNLIQAIIGSIVAVLVVRMSMPVPEEAAEDEG